MRLALLAGFVLCSLTAAATPRALRAQHVDSVVTEATMESFARAHLAISALRDRVQAELAEPKSKKPEVQAELREKLRTGRLAILKEHGLSDEAFARLTHRVATDDGARKAFEALLAKLAEKK
ncbi:MAG TPA: DUF4168 domain-containing protein [Gemmatimonadaceae bacterium]|nr:DUF4168 domain-containing protein [Gemmatimonadaceae bacterium]